MREIKFRALRGSQWHHFDFGNAQRWAKDLLREMAEDDFELKFDTPFLQFTGLKDKNGQEIFEGDILKSEEIAISLTDKQIEIRGADVVQSEWVGKVEWDKEGADYNLVCDGIEIGFPRHDSTFEILGNIFEHPHLLKPSPSEKEK